MVPPKTAVANVMSIIIREQPNSVMSHKIVAYLGS